MTPLIGITMDYSPKTDIRPFSKGDDVFYQNTAYVRYLEKAECTPVLLPTLLELSKVAATIASLDGLILSGGDDVLPEFYSEKTMNSKWRIDGPRTYFEAKLITEALKQDKPIYGICRGCQMLNVALGGNMFQDISTQVPGAIEHFSHNKPEWEYHKIMIAQDSLLHSIANIDEIRVSTSHHQAIKDVAPNLRVVATAADGIIEAVEMSEKKFVVGVQWHPEVMIDDPVQLIILRAFVNVCKQKIKTTNFHELS